VNWTNNARLLRRQKLSRPPTRGTYGAMALLLCAIGAAASWIPARGVVRIDPIVVLREESVTA
jgi:hypothetical protein